MAQDDDRAGARPATKRPVLRSLGHRGLPEMIAEQIIESIRVTPLDAGDRLPAETELARQLGVGRTSVREALRTLQALGIVTVVRGRGVFVADPAQLTDGANAFASWSAEARFAIEDLLETRISLECAAAGLAAARATDEQISTLESFNEAHRDGAVRGSLPQVVTTDEQFHEAIFRASGNTLMAELYGAMVAELTTFRRRTLAVPGVPERSADAHAKIVDAIRRHEPSDARRAMGDHLWVLYRDVQAAAVEHGSRESGERVAAPRAALVEPS